MVLKEELYSIVEVRAEFKALTLFSSAEAIRTKDQVVIAASSAVDTYLPKVDEFLGGLFTNQWLHLDLLTDGRTSYTVGYNVLLASGQEAYASAIVHELVHTYNSHLASRTPTFITEGIPELIAFITTGKTTLGGLATGEKVHLTFFNDVSSSDYFDEAANGFMLFYRLLELMGKPTLSRAITSILRNNLTDGRAILRQIRELSPNQSAIDALLASFVADYRP